MHLLRSIKTGIQHHLYFFLTFPFIAVLYATFQLMTSWNWSTCLLMSWNLVIYAYLFFTLKKLWRIDHAHILQRAKEQDASKWLILFLVLLTLFICFIALIIEVNNLPSNTLIQTAHIILSMVTITSAWFLMHTIFAIHYAHDFYLALDKNNEGGLEFPKTPRPTYPDFLYFSYIVGTSAQTADVSITHSAMRVLNTLHLLLAYGFNTTILAITINVAANFISP